MELKIRKLNANEKYACSTKHIKQMFQATDALILFGFLSRTFAFDFRDTNRPRINGTVVMSAAINTRDGAAEQPCNHPIISFYAIRDIHYDIASEQAFVESYLPALYRWYESVMARPKTALSGVEVFMVEWDSGTFKAHSYRYT